MSRKRTKKLRKAKNTIYKNISLALIVASTAFLGMLYYIDLLPSKYFITIFIGILSFDIFNIFIVNLRRLKRGVKRTLSTFMIIAIFIMTLVTFYVGKTVGILLNNGDSKYKIENYSVVVLKDKSYQRIDDLKGERIGYFKKSDAVKDATKRLKNEVECELNEYETSDNLIKALFESKVEAIVLENSMISIIGEENPEIMSSIKKIYSFKVKIKVESTMKDVDVTKKPFAIYISGIDTYGEISSVSRSDVNIVMIVNPTVHQILLISIPRDYYVSLHGINGASDKLTHAGIYGIDMSIHTIEDLLDIDINYFLKVNFTSVIDIVNALGGLDVYSDYTFMSYSGFSFKEGMNYVNGEQALDFARTRKAFKDGDRQRGKNQQALIESIIRKVTSKKVITKYDSLLNAINGKYQTNMSMKKITAVIKKQLNEMKSWDVTSYSLSGYDDIANTYTYNKPLYVMKPDNASINEAKKLINKILNGEKLENSYKNIGGSSNKVK